MEIMEHTTSEYSSADSKAGYRKEMAEFRDIEGGGRVILKKEKEKHTK